MLLQHDGEKPNWRTDERYYLKCPFLSTMDWAWWTSSLSTTIIFMAASTDSSFCSSIWLRRRCRCSKSVVVVLASEIPRIFERVCKSHSRCSQSCITVGGRNFKQLLYTLHLTPGAYSIQGLPYSGACVRIQEKSWMLAILLSFTAAQIKAVSLSEWKKMNRVLTLQLR